MSHLSRTELTQIPIEAMAPSLITLVSLALNFELALYTEFPDLAHKSTNYPVKVEFQRNNNF